MLKIKWIKINKKCCFYLKKKRFKMAILVISFPKYGPQIKLLEIGPAEKTPKIREDSKMSPSEKIKRDENGKLVHDMVIPV